VDFKADMDKLLKRLAEMPPAEGFERVYYAGLIEHEEIEQRKEHGIPYHREVVEWFNNTAGELELDYHLP
ncbi:MAG: Ldh family oxidoreductase, partial [Pseudomonadota bacterium]